MIRRLATFFAEREPTTSIDLVRTLLGAVLLVDYVGLRLHGVAEVVYGAPTDASVPAWVAWVARHATPSDVVTSAAPFALLLSLRILPRVSASVLLLLSAWLGFALPAADRGVDVLTRWALVYLALAPVGRPLVITSRVRAESAEREGLAWPRRLLVFQLALVYTSTGLTKLSGPWTFEGGFRAVELTLANTAYVRDARTWIRDVPALCRALTIGTLVFERSAFLLLTTRSFVSSSRASSTSRTARVLEGFRRGWIASGIAFHLSLAMVLALGSFPFVCLALYPALLRPGELVALKDAVARRVRRSAFVRPSPREAT